MKYLVGDLHNPGYRVVDELGDTIYVSVVEMPVRPKRGQFWRSRSRGYVYVSSIYNMSPKSDDENTYRGVSVVYMSSRKRQKYMGGHEIRASSFLTDYTYVADRETIMELLEQLLCMVPSTKKAQSILRLKVLDLSEEEKGMLLLRALDV